MERGFASRFLTAVHIVRFLKAGSERGKAACKAALHGGSQLESWYLLQQEFDRQRFARTVDKRVEPSDECETKQAAVLRVL